MVEQDHSGKGSEIILSKGPEYPSSMLPEIVVGGVRFAMTREMSVERAERIVHGEVEEQPEEQGAEAQLNPEKLREIETQVKILELRTLLKLLEPF